MTDKGVKKHLQRTIKNWIENIDDKHIKELVINNSIITGGAIVSLFNNEQPKDYDVYFDNKNVVKEIAEYYVNKFNDAHGDIKNKIGYRTKAFILDGAIPLEEQLAQLEHLKGKDASKDNFNWGSHMLTNLEEDRIKIIVRSDGVASENDDHLKEPFEDVYDTLDNNDNFQLEQKLQENIVNDADEIPADMVERQDKGKEKYRPIFLSSNAITLANKIQIVIRFHGTPEKIHENYDFVHCMSYYLPKNNSLHYNEKILRSIMERHLIYQGSRYPVCSIIRTRKFIKRGWHINAGQYIKMCFQVSQLDLTDINVLSDQLVGVDSAYFIQLIDVLKSKIDKDKDFIINEGYISTLIDRIFSF